MIGPLEKREIDSLFTRLEEALYETASRFRWQMGLVAMFFFVMAAIYGFTANQWGIAAFIAAFGVGMVVIGVAASRRTAPEKMRPVVDALRTAPERIVSVRHQTTGQGRMFETHWLEIKTNDHRLFFKAPDWEHLFARLERHCPNAAFIA